MEMHFVICQKPQEQWSNQIHSKIWYEPIPTYQSSLNKSTAQISATAESVVDSAEQFEFRPIRSSKFQINQPVAFKIQIVQLNLIY